MADDPKDDILSRYGPPAPVERDDILRQYTDPRWVRPEDLKARPPNPDWNRFALPPREPRAELRNVHRPDDPFMSAAREYMGADAAAKGAYGIGHTVGDTYLQGKEGNWGGVAGNLAELTAAIFAGPRAKTANHTMLARAQEMAGKGADRNAIWKDTGWFQGKDGKWRFEIDDSGAKYGLGKAKGLDNDVVSHPDLLAAYPELARQKMKIGDDYYAGYFSPITRSIDVQSTNPGDRQHIATHELQHRVSGIEGFPRGSSPDMVRTLPEFKDLDYKGKSAESRDFSADYVYKRVAGEVEADNAALRNAMSTQERRETPPWKTEPVAPAQQVAPPSHLQSLASIWSSLPWYFRYPAYVQAANGAYQLAPARSQQPEEDKTK